jgi:hypothetical protein
MHAFLSGGGCRSVPGDDRSLKTGARREAQGEELKARK